MWSLQNAGEFVVLAQSTERRWQRAVQHERSLRVQLQENIETLASEMHGLEARCQENSGASASGISIGERKPHPPGLLGEYSMSLPGKPMQYGRVNFEGTTKALSMKESDTESVTSTQAVTLDATDGGRLSTSVTKEEDEDSEFFDALEHSSVVTSSMVAMTTEGVTVKDSDSIMSSSVASTASASPKIQSSRATSDKEDQLPGPERIDRQLDVSLTCLHGNKTINAYVTQYEKTGLMYSKYTSSYYSKYLLYGSRY